jgi:hypothetical protein
MIGWSVGKSYNWETQQFYTATGIQDHAIITDIDTMISSLKSNSLLSLARMILPVVGGSENTHKRNLLNPSGIYGGSFNPIFVGGWTHDSNGMTPNGTTGYANTGFNPFQNQPSGLGSIGIYSRTNSTGTICDMGASNQTETQQASIWSRFGDVFYGLQNTTGSVSSVANTDSRGWFFASRTATGNNFLQKNSTQNTFTETMGIPDFNIYIGARNRNNAAEFFTARQYSFVWIGEALSTTQASTLYTIIQTFQTSRGRNV